VECDYFQAVFGADLGDVLVESNIAEFSLIAFDGGEEILGFFSSTRKGAVSRWVCRGSVVATLPAMSTSWSRRRSRFKARRTSSQASIAAPGACPSAPCKARRMVGSVGAP